MFSVLTITGLLMQEAFFLLRHYKQNSVIVTRSVFICCKSLNETSDTPEINLARHVLMCTISLFSGQFLTSTRKVTTQTEPTTGFSSSFIPSSLYSLTLPHWISFHRDFIF